MHPWKLTVLVNIWFSLLVFRCSYEAQAKQIASELESNVYRGRDQSSDAVMKHYYGILQKEQQLFEDELQNLPDFTPGKKGMQLGCGLYCRL